MDRQTKIRKLIEMSVISLILVYLLLTITEYHWEHKGYDDLACVRLAMDCVERLRYIEWALDNVNYKINRELEIYREQETAFYSLLDVLMHVITHFINLMALSIAGIWYICWLAWWSLCIVFLNVCIWFGCYHPWIGIMLVILLGVYDKYAHRF